MKSLSLFCLQVRSLYGTDRQMEGQARPSLQSVRTAIYDITALCIQLNAVYAYLSHCMLVCHVVDRGVVSRCSEPCMCHLAVMICVMLCLSLSHTAGVCVVYHAGVVNTGVVDRGVVDTGVVDRGVLLCALQVFRALRVSLGCNHLCDVLSLIVSYR